MKYIPVSLLFMVLMHSTYAQESQIITTKLDTLIGKVNIAFGDQYNDDAVSVKRNKKKERYLAYEVSTIILEDSSVLLPIKMDGRYQFVKLIQNGSSLKLYGFNDLMSTRNNFEFKMFVRADGSICKIGNLGFKKRILQFLSQCNIVSNKIMNDTYGKNDLIKIAQEYNACTHKERRVIDNVVVEEKDATKMDGLIAAINNSDLEGREELLDMLIDVKSKMTSQKTIPSYLENAIMEKLANSQDFVSWFKSIVEDK